MNLTEEKTSEELTYWLEELKLYEEQSAKLTESIEKQNEENAQIEAILMKLISENINVASCHPRSASPLTNAADDARSNSVSSLQDEIEAARRTLQGMQKNEELAGTALARIAAYISLHDGNYNNHLNGLGVAAQCFHHIWNMSEEHNGRLKTRPKMASSEMLVDGPLLTPGKTQLQFSETEKKMAPLYVEATRMAVFLSEYLAAVTTSLQSKEKLCLINRRHLEDEHEAAKARFVMQRELLKDVHRTVENAKEVLQKLQAMNDTKKKTRDALQKELKEIEGFPKHAESVIVKKETVGRISTEINALRQALEEASKLTQKTQAEERRAMEMAQFQTLALERARHDAGLLQEEILVLGREKIELQEQIEACRKIQQKQIREAAQEQKRVKEFSEEEAKIEEAQKLFEKEMEPFTASLNTARKRTEMMKTQLESKINRRAMLEDEKTLIKETVEKLKAEWTSSYNAIIEMRKSILVLKQQVAETSKKLQYVNSLGLDTVLPISPTLPLDPQGASSGAVVDNLREMLNLQKRYLLAKARKEHRHNGTVTDTSCINEAGSNTAVAPVVENKAGLRDSPVLTATQELLCSTSTLVGDVHAPKSTSHHDNHHPFFPVGQEFKKEYLLMPLEEQPTSVTSQILGYTNKNLFSCPSMSSIAAPDARGKSVLPDSEVSVLSAPGMMRALSSSEVPNGLNGEGNIESTPTMAHINFRLQEILGRRH